MYRRSARGTASTSSFDGVAKPFLQQAGLPFAEVLSGETIERAFAQNDALFAQDDIFSTPIVLLAFLAQVLRGGKAGACAAASWRWHGLDAKLIDGFTFTMPDTPAMVGRELWVTLLAYNLIRRLIATAAAVRGKAPRQLGFTLACQTVLSSWMLLATGLCRDARQLATLALQRIAANEVANRPGRIEPRVIKRRRHHYPLMQKPRDQLHQALREH